MFSQLLGLAIALLNVSGYEDNLGGLVMVT